jgi:DNA (cytosine-5)-methyltransferase 1
VRVNDFFCGAGGMGLAFKLEGFEIAGAWDFDKYAVQSYRENVGEHVKQMDITTMKASDVSKADVWTFGFPCQDLSVAGKQAGLFEGKRSGLFFEVMRLLDETSHRPSILLAENVRGLKKYLPVLEQEYAKRGYKMTYALYNSKYWGVPQSRERYYVIGVRESENPFSFPEQQTQYIPKLSSILEPKVDEKYYISDEKAARIIEQALQRVELKGVHACITPDRVDKRQNGRRAKGDEESSFTITAQDLHGIICINPRKEDGTQTYQQDRVYDPEGYLPAVTSQLNGRMNIIEPQINVIGMLDMKGKDQWKRVYDTEGLAPTLVCSGGGYHEPKILDEIRFRVRKLTPREYARLQGFPEWYKFVVSDSQLYKQFGNAVTVNVVQAIARKIKEVYS